MKVLHIITSLNTGGAEKLIVDGLPFYTLEGVEVDLVMLQGGKSLFEMNLESKFKGNISSLSLGSPYNPLHIFKLRKYIKKYDLLHVHLFPALYWVVLARFLSFNSIPIIYTEHSTENRRRKNKFFRLCDKWIYSKLDYIGCISVACYQNLKKHLNYKKNKISVIENGINLELFNNYNFLENRKELSYNFNLIQVSSFRKQKDQKTVIRALNLLPADITLTLVGDGILRSECESLVKELKLEDRVIFTGNRIDIPNLLGQSDLVIQSSNYEGFGLVAVEAMAAGKAVIVSDVEGLRDVVKDYGVLFSKGDFKILAKEILKFYENKSYKKEIESKCVERAKDFDIKLMVRKYISIYKTLLNN